MLTSNFSMSCWSQNWDFYHQQDQVIAWLRCRKGIFCFSGVNLNKKCLRIKWLHTILKTVGYLTFLKENGVKSSWKVKISHFKGLFMWKVGKIKSLSLEEAILIVKRNWIYWDFSSHSTRPNKVCEKETARQIMRSNSMAISSKWQQVWCIVHHIR